MKATIINHTKQTKQYFCASGSLLLPLAQKWGLVLVILVGLFAQLATSITTHPSASAVDPKPTPNTEVTDGSGPSDKPVDNTEVTDDTGPSLSISIPTTPLNLNVVPTATGSTFSSAQSTFSVSSDAYWGYQFSIKSKDNSNALVNGSNTIPSITAQLDENTFKTSTSYTNMWGYKPSKLNGSDNTKYIPGPNATSTTIDTTSSASSSATNYTITLGVKVDNTLPTGDYKQSFVLTATANTASYSITYNLNGGSDGPSPTTQTGTTTGITITLSNTKPTRDGYSFEGWCTVSTDNETCTEGQTYHPGDTYTLASRSTTLSLYAMWKQDALPMQNWQGCSDLAANETVTLKDMRDNKTYTVTKLGSLCWMTQNLAIGSNDSPTTLHSSDSDVASDFTLPKGTTAKSTSSDTSDTGGWHYQQYNTKRIWISTDATYASEYGGYYSWYAATAGEGTGGSGGMSSGDTQHSICPKGWRLPTSAEITTLTSGGNSSPNKTNGKLDVYAGYCDEDGCPRRYGSFGSWWSSTAYSSDGAYVLYSLSSDFYLNLNYKGFGYSVRCVARDIKSMQDVSSWADSVKQGETVTTIDERDGNTYTVARLANGRLWMTQNLRIAGQTLTPDTSDVTKEFEIPASDINSFKGVSESSSLKAVYIDPTYGGYYNRYLVIANDDHGTDSICPKGWRPPTSNEYRTLANAYGNSASALMSAPANFALSGQIELGRCGGSSSTGAVSNNGVTSDYWSSTSECNYETLYLSKTSVDIGKLFHYSCGNSAGAHLRCVQRVAGENYQAEGDRYSNYSHCDDCPPGCSTTPGGNVEVGGDAN